MKGISINGIDLHKILMPLVPHEGCKSVSSLCYPKQRIEFESYDNMLELTIPTKLALEMYRIGIFPQDKSLAFPVTVGGKSVGQFKVIKLLYPNNLRQEDVVFITLLMH